MDVFSLRDSLVDAYRQYATSFMRFRDPRVAAYVEEELDSGRLWPHPRVGLNPSFEPGGYIDDLTRDGTLHDQCRDIFRLEKSESDPRGKPLRLHKHQADAVGAAAAGRNYVLTTGTGSGKSLAYIIPIVDRVLREGSGGGVKALVVYPMNALVNSQIEELEKFLQFGPWDTPPVTFKRFTGQDSPEEREKTRNNPPDIILTNYVMLEYILTRYTDQPLVKAMKGLRFLVLDELHTYRGRQGADVAMLVRRVREATKSPGVQCVGTSATLSTEGDHDSRRQGLASVGSRLFGAALEAADVIGETLQKITPNTAVARPGHGDALAEATRRGEPPASFEGFVADPLSGWIENTLGVREENGRLARAVPLPVAGRGGAAQQLSDDTGVDRHVCEETIRAYLLAGNRVENPDTDSPVFPFRLHQFISRGDTVYATPEPPSTRTFSLSGERFVAGSNPRRVLLPLVFCRTCGQDYYMAHRRSGSSPGRLKRRRLDDNQTRDGLSPGFWYVSEENPWPENQAEAWDRLPPDWFDPRTGRLRSNRRNHQPEKMRISPDGHANPGGTAGWWVPAPFPFCLACGAAPSTITTNEFPRLSTLGAGGRASAATIMSLKTIQHLRNNPELEPKARKILSFTDNRQDASLQAGHFNDFVQVTTLRSALWRAVTQAGEAGIRHSELPQRVFDAMALPRKQYAQEPDQHEMARHRTDRTMRKVLEYRLYRDFERGWRVAQPNLEQAGLLRIDYEYLPELAAAPQAWAGCHPALAGCDPAKREHVLRVLLDFVRQELGLYVDVLHPAEQESLQREAGQHLAGAWGLRGETLLPATDMVTHPRDSRSRGTRRRYVTSRSLFGRFLRRFDTLRVVGLEETDLVIGQIVERLGAYSLLKQVGGKTKGREVWQVPAAALVWKPADGTPFRDYLRVARSPEHAQANQFFSDLYRNTGTETVGIEGREHTAQVSNEKRIDREERFRSADLPVLFCSPTMELGVDISQLNVVNMRNVPPTPANYAQRSGRAGRSGQPALVFTYCSSGNSHDQHFFRQQHKMVSGQVETPRIDLANEHLLRSHIHAVWLAESRLDLKQSMSHILDMGENGAKPRVKPHVRDALDNKHTTRRARERAGQVLAGLEPELEGRAWWHDDWLDDTLAKIPGRFEQALERWMALYMAALEQFRRQSEIAVSPSRSTHDQKRARRLRDEAERQLDVLRAKSDHRGQSDFYTYRYFASEGFLPGYSFPRLPLSAFIPGQAGRARRGDYVQRPRFLAINEFGPRTFIYHEGARYRINRVLLSSSTDTPQETAAGLTVQAKRCDQCGYMHQVNDQTGQDICGYCENRLGAPMSGLLQMRNVSTRYSERITSDEERRRREGYELISGVEFAERRGRRSVTKASLVSDDQPLLELAYGETATIWRVNLGWRRRSDKHDQGFYIDTERGEWARRGDDTKPGSVGETATTRKVIPFVKDTRNSLLVQPAQTLEPEEMASLAAALKAAIQVVFQLEPNELAAEPLPTRDNRQLLLFYESAEGGAGALKHLVDDIEWWRRVADEALRLCHATPETEDGGCGAACYECLLTYQNQFDHELLDRAKVIPVLRQLADTQIKRHAAGPLKTGSTLEDKFVDMLRSGEYRRPDRAQVHFPAARTRPDFLYDEACAAIYVDGPHHDYPDRAARDRDQEQALLSLGYRTIRFHHQADWQRIIDGHPEVFGTGNRNRQAL